MMFRALVLLPRIRRCANHGRRVSIRFARGPEWMDWVVCEDRRPWEPAIDRPADHAETPTLQLVSRKRREAQPPSADRRW